jgi:hypothetical protein
MGEERAFFKGGVAFCDAALVKAKFLLDSDAFDNGCDMCLNTEMCGDVYWPEQSGEMKSPVSVASQAVFSSERMYSGFDLSDNAHGIRFSKSLQYVIGSKANQENLSKRNVDPFASELCAQNRLESQENVRFPSEHGVFSSLSRKRGYSFEDVGDYGTLLDNLEGIPQIEPDCPKEVKEEADSYSQPTENVLNHIKEFSSLNFAPNQFYNLEQTSAVYASSDDFDESLFVDNLCEMLF